MTFFAGSKIRASDLNSLPYDINLGGQYRTTGTATSGTTELQVVTTAALVLDANSKYNIEFCYNGATNSGTTERWGVRIKKTNVAGAQLCVRVLSNASTASDPEGETLSLIYPTTVTETTVFVGTVQRLTSNLAGNTLTNSILGDTFIQVTKLPASASFTAL